MMVGLKKGERRWVWRRSAEKTKANSGDGGQKFLLALIAFGRSARPPSRAIRSMFIRPGRVNLNVPTDRVEPPRHKFACAAREEGNCARLAEMLGKQYLRAFPTSWETFWVSVGPFRTPLLGLPSW
jgi:hypothetical protein